MRLTPHRTPHLIATLALAGALAACSSAGEAVDDGGNGSTVLAGGYLTISVAMPAGMGTRADDGGNDQFDPGTDDESAVNDATLMLFAGASADKATLLTTIELDAKAGKADAGGGNVTHSLTQTIELPDKYDTGSNRYYALAVLNHNDVFTVSDGKVTVDNVEFSGTLKELNNAVANKSDRHLKDKGILMANAPISSIAGGAQGASMDKAKQSVTTLVDVTSNIKHSETDAAQTPATIVVERALAKVRVSKSTKVNDKAKPSAKVVDGKDSNTKALDWNIQSWGFTNRNRKTYLTRNFDTNTFYNQNTHQRMVGAQPIYSQGGESFYRTYFAKDLNYDKDASGLFQAKQRAHVITGDGKPEYCMENTFNVANMKQKNATHVIIRVQLEAYYDEKKKDWRSFYVFDGDRSVIYNNTDAVKILAEKVLEANGGKEALLEKMLQTDAGKALASKFQDTSKAYAQGEFGRLNNNTGEIKLMGVSFYPSEKDYQKNGGKQGYTDKLTYNLEANNDQTPLPLCQEYTSGCAYYAVPIRHFSDTYTSWSTGDASGSVSYPGEDSEQRWLGRYGVVRNNWYDIVIDGVYGIGEPAPPQMNGDTWVDQAEEYCHATIHVQPWNKRVQRVDASR